jgi:hypothetical protein
MEKFLKKYGSRKFLIALFTDVLCVATILSGYGGDIGLIGSILAIVVNSAIYIVNEAKIDVESVHKIIDITVEDFEEIKNAIKSYEEECDNEDNE